MEAGNGLVAQELILNLTLEYLILSFRVKSSIKIVFILKSGCQNLKVVIILIFMIGIKDRSFMLSKLCYKIIKPLSIMRLKKTMF